MCMTLYKLYHSKQIPPCDLFIKYIKTKTLMTWDFVQGCMKLLKNGKD